MWLLLLVDMAQDPAFLFYPGDYLRDTQCLSENVQVAYDRIMCEHMRNICISQSQLKFFTKKLNESEIEELKNVLTEENGNYMIKWVAESINKRRDYSDSRRKNRAKKTKEDMCNISKTYDEHMENEIENVNEIKNVIKNEKPKNSKQEKKPESEFPEYKESMQAYHDFYKSRTGVNPSIKAQDGKALKDLILHFRQMATNGNTVLDGMLYIFNHWQKLDDFTQKQIDISKIYTNINSIISQLKSKKKNGNTNTGNTDYESAEFRDSMFAKIDAAYGKK